jgi:energy-coupling factor transporter ATP-binding protein EcfA2
MTQRRQNSNQMLSKNMIFEEVALGLENRGIEADKIKERSKINSSGSNTKMAAIATRRFCP